MTPLDDEDMPPIEAGARALCRLDGHPEDTLFEGKPMWTMYVTEARTVIASLISPSEAMREVGARVFAAEHNGPDDAAVDAFMQMIDAALDEGLRG